MKKILVTGAILSLLSAPVFAQEANTAAGQTGTAATGTAATGTAASTASTGGFFGGSTGIAGLSTGAAVAIGVAVAAVAVAASDDDSSTSHSATTHH